MIVGLSNLINPKTQVTNSKKDPEIFDVYETKNNEVTIKGRGYTDRREQWDWISKEYN